MPETTLKDKLTQIDTLAESAITQAVIDGQQGVANQCQAILVQTGNALTQLRAEDARKAGAEKAKKG